MVFFLLTEKKKKLSQVSKPGHTHNTYFKSHNIFSDICENYQTFFLSSFFGSKIKLFCWANRKIKKN